MSTKIMVAYRLRPRVDLWALVTHITEQGRRNARAVLTEIAKRVHAKPAEAAELGLTIPLGVTHEAFGYMEIGLAMRRAYVAQVGDVGRNAWDLGVSVAVHRVGRRILLRPFAGSGFLGRTLDFLATMPELEDYHYQNSFDRPRRVTPVAWDRRRQVWDRAMYPNLSWRPFMAIDVVSISAWSEIDPCFELALAKARASKGTGR